MDFERSRAHALRRGFAAFLQAPADQRAPILEQLTGTEIYSDISKRVHARVVLERTKLETLEAELAGIHLLEEAEEQRPCGSGIIDRTGFQRRSPTGRNRPCSGWRASVPSAN